MPSPPTGRADRAPAAVLVLALAIAGCGDRDAADFPPLPPAGEPVEAALAFFQAAQTGRHAPQALVNLVRADLDAGDRAALQDLLGSLRATNRARVVGSVPVDPERTSLDVEISLLGGGTASYTVQTARAADGTWRVTSVLGPDRSWPPPPAPAGEGLSSSPPPR